MASEGGKYDWTIGLLDESIEPRGEKGAIEVRWIGMLWLLTVYFLFFDVISDTNQMTC